MLTGDSCTCSLDVRSHPQACYNLHAISVVVAGQYQADCSPADGIRQAPSGSASASAAVHVGTTSHLLESSAPGRDCMAV